MVLLLETSFQLGEWTDSLNTGWQASFFLPFLHLYSPLHVHFIHYPSNVLNIHPCLPSSRLVVFITTFPLLHLRPLTWLSPKSHPNIHPSSIHPSLSLFFSSCSSRQPSWQQAMEVTSRQAWRFLQHRSTRWGRSTSTASRPPLWPRCRVSFIKPWVSTRFH